MVKHIILWQLKDELSPAEKAAVKQKMKAELEGLLGRIPGLLSMEVQIEGLASSNAEVMLYSTFVDAAALATYTDHPDHMAVATTAVRPFVKTRLCLDFEAE